MIDIIYYAHSMDIYGTPQEQEELAILHDFFRGGCIYNPNRPFIQKHTDPMTACIETVNDESMTALAFSLHHGVMSPGVLFEAKTAQKRSIPIYMILGGISLYTGDFYELRKPTAKPKKTTRKRKRR